MTKHYVWATTLCLFLVSSINTSGQVTIAAVDIPYSQDFNTLAITGNANAVTTLPLGWTFVEAGTAANVDAAYAAGTGSGTAGNTYSFGAASSTERALGGLQSGTFVTTIGAGFQNNTGRLITSLRIVYTGEQWRLGNLSREDRIDFQYSLNATSPASGTWSDVDGLDFTGPKTAGTVGLLNGNDPTNRIIFDVAIDNLEIVSGSVFWIRWTDLMAPVQTMD
jgi:hypothetical protein